LDHSLEKFLDFEFRNVRLNRNRKIQISSPDDNAAPEDGFLSSLTLGAVQTSNSNGRETFAENLFLVPAGWDQEKQGRAAV
jgi:hypothetical protein